MLFSRFSFVVSVTGALASLFFCSLPAGSRSNVPLNKVPAPSEHPVAAGGRVGHAVDLGLSVLWSDVNFGAQFPEDKGSFFGYGDITGEKVSTSYNDYVSEDIAGTERDPAYSFWGAGWRMPHASEIAELVDRCDWHWTKVNGVEGYRVVGRGGASIFLPAVGHRSGDKFFFEGQRGYYWSGDVNEFDPNYVSILFFYRDDKLVRDYRKIYGFAIRPVCE